MQRCKAVLSGRAFEAFVAAYVAVALVHFICQYCEWLWVQQGIVLTAVGTFVFIVACYIMAGSSTAQPSK
jgi:hypothetical protein